MLEAELVAEARAEELKRRRKIELFDEAPVIECWERTDRPPVSTKWVDVNRGTAEKPDVRCRLVARNFKPKGEKDREDVFAAMPPNGGSRQETMEKREVGQAKAHAR